VTRAGLSGTEERGREKKMFVEYFFEQAIEGLPDARRAMLKHDISVGDPHLLPVTSTSLILQSYY
jgi:hypothetical protein